MMNAQKIVNSLVSGLAPRQKEVILGRFGLGKYDEPQTLAALGDQYGITRERVRQIEATTLAGLSKEVMADSALRDFFDKTTRYLKTSGGALKKEEMLSFGRTLIDGLNDRQLDFLLATSPAFQYSPEDEHSWAFYYSDKNSLKVTHSTVERLVKFLRGHKDAVLDSGYDAHVKEFLKREGLTAQLAESYIGISKRVHTNAYGDTGLREWEEINPLTIRDCIYLVLKKQKKPLHFEEIAKAINEVGCMARPALVPTVHNELIKDARFVLVGRGIYALSEHGYEPGTAKEVIHRILKKKGALKPNDIILAVQEERFFKPNTIVANLQNKSLFKRDTDGSYRVREA